MQLNLSRQTSRGYKSPAQKARIDTENWAEKNLFCPACFSSLLKAPNNFPATDFFCTACDDSFELKSKKGRFGSRVVDGAYSTMVARVRENSQPNLFLLAYSRDYWVTNLLLIPNFCVTEEIIERRNPLADTARRAGWVGCNLRIDGIPENGRIAYVKESKLASRKVINSRWRELFFLRKFDNENRRWLVFTMAMVQRLNKPTFCLSEVYAFESELKRIFPQNNNVRAKIRQQLQILRDEGWLDFLGGARYSLNY